MSIRFAAAIDATVIVPANVYVYGDQSGPWRPDTPHLPCSRKGAIRAEMEADYRNSGVPVILLRGGDFLLPDAAGSVMNRVVMKGLARGRLTAIAASRGLLVIEDAAHARPIQPRLAPIPAHCIH